MVVAFKVASCVHNSIVLVVVAIVIEVARAPLLGQTPGLPSWIVVRSLTFGGRLGETIRPIEVVQASGTEY